MFNFKNVSVDRPSFVGYGINHDVTIVGVESGNSQKGTEFIQLNVKKTGDSDDNATILKMYFTIKAQPITMRKIMGIHAAVAKLELLKSKSFNSTKELADSLNAMWKGKRFRLKLQGSEYVLETEEGPVIKTRTEIPMRNFTEAIMGDAERAPISDADTKLTFDKNDKWDFRRLSAEDLAKVGGTPNETGNDSKKDDDLPF